MNRGSRFAVLAAVLALASVLSASSAIHQSTNSPIHQSHGPARIISLVPAATEMLFAMGAGPHVVAVGSFDTYPPQVRALPRVGALLDPDVERILSLKPDLVVVYATQTDLKAQLARAGIALYEYRHAALADVSTTITSLGNVTGHDVEARALTSRIARDLDEIRTRVAGRPRPKTLLVFGRERGALRGIYASGGYGFLDDMLRIAGGDNVFADLRQESVQASTEQILARRPEVILEIRASDSAMSFGERTTEVATWRALPSLPAVRTGRVHFLVDDRLVVPGPRVAEGARLMAQALHPEVF